MAEKAPAQTLRARVRAEMTDEIKRVALQHLAADGSALSLRAVARDMGMVSSALYRYFPSRDDLLTALILDAYNALGEIAEAADAAYAVRDDFAGRWLAVGHAMRAWSVARPHEYALIYGSPIPGYAAPADTIEPANRPVVVLARIVADAHDVGELRTPVGDPELPAALTSELGVVTAGLDLGTSAAVTGRFLVALTEMMGALNFEIFGRYNNVLTEFTDWFDWQLRSMTAYLGLSGDNG